MIFPGFFHRYPYTDFQELNLDWVLRQVLANKEAIAEITTEGIDVIVENILNGWLTDGTIEQIVKADLGYITPGMYGALGDGVTDDSQAFMDAMAAAKDQNLMLYLPANEGVTILSDITVEPCKNIYFLGNIGGIGSIYFQGDKNDSVISYRFHDVEPEVKFAGMTNCLHMITGTAENVTIFADGDTPGITSCAYNLFLWSGRVKNLTFDSLGAGWINENVFYRGRIGNLTFTDNGTYSHNNNIFSDCTFEGSTFDIAHALSNYFGGRYENAGTLTFREGARNNVVDISNVASARMQSGMFSRPSYFNDLYGHNFCTRRGAPAVKSFERLITANSYNYNAAQASPASGKITTTAAAVLIDTGIFSIERDVLIEAMCDAPSNAFRWNLYLYDETMNLITSVPDNAFWYEGFASRAWSTDHYTVNSNVNSTYGKLHRYSNAGEDSGVCYARFLIRTPNARTFNALGLYISTATFNAIDPLPATRLTASGTPLAGDWRQGELAINTAAGATDAAYFFNGSSWVPVATLS